MSHLEILAGVPVDMKRRAAPVPLAAELELWIVSCSH
jgi:hypothetical protein